MNNLIWSVRRELWENRAIYVAPLVVACVVLVGFFISLVTLPAKLRPALTAPPETLHVILEQPYLVSAIILMAVEIVVAILYSLDALYGERRDRSVLFWKSMPVSDATAVLSKASIPILVLPIVAWATTVVTQAIMLVATRAVLSANGISVSILDEHLSLVEISWINFGHLVAFHGLWCAPLFAWLLLASAWATRVPFLWAVLPPVAIGIVEKVAFNSTNFARLLQVYFFGAGDATAAHSMTMAMLTMPLGQMLLSPTLWAGLALSAVFLFGAVRLRRSQGVL